MDLRQLEYFCAVADAGSVSSAARILQMAQPTLTVSIRKLERQMGAQLFIRGSTGVILTEAGRYLRGESTKMLRDAANAQQHLLALAEGRAGHVSIAATPAYSWAHLATVLSDIGAKAPTIQIDLSDPPPGEILERVLDGRCDVGIVATWDLAHFRLRYGDRLHDRVICDLPVVIAAPAADAHGASSISLDELRGRPWIVPRKSPQFHGVAALVDRLWHEHEWNPSVVREVSTSQTALPMVAGGLGVALMPKSLGQLAGPAVSLLSLTDPTPTVQAVSIWRRERRPSPATQVLLAALERVGAGTPPQPGPLSPLR